MNLVMLGPPGAGKGTQTEFIKEVLNIPSISTGGIFRQIVKDNTEMGRRIKDILDKGMYVPDEITVDIVRNRIGQQDCANGFILDGFPRTLNQAEAFDKLVKVDIALFIDVPDEEIEKRMASRKTCGQCGSVYGAANGAEKLLKCPKCGGELTVRSDDSPEVVGKRLEVYRSLTQPVIEFYRAQGKLKTVSGVGAVEDIFNEVKKALNID